MFLYPTCLSTGIFHKREIPDLISQANSNSQNADVLAIMYKEITYRLCRSCLHTQVHMKQMYFRFLEGPVPKTVTSWCSRKCSNQWTIPNPNQFQVLAFQVRVEPKPALQFLTTACALLRSSPWGWLTCGSQYRALTPSHHSDTDLDVRSQMRLQRFQDAFP